MQAHFSALFWVFALRNFHFNVVKTQLFSLVIERMNLLVPIFNNEASFLLTQGLVLADFCLNLVPRIVLVEARGWNF